MQLTKILPDDQIEAILRVMLLNKPVEVLKTIPRMGRNQISWIYIKCTITNNKRATFVSFASFSEAFWQWLETVELMALALWKRIAIAQVIWESVPEGVEVYHTDLGWVELIEKSIDSFTNAPQFWVSKDDQLHKVDPACIREFLW